MGGSGRSVTEQGGPASPTKLKRSGSLPQFPAGIIMTARVKTETAGRGVGRGAGGSGMRRDSGGLAGMGMAGASEAQTKHPA